MTKDEVKKAYTMREILHRYSIKINRNGKAKCPFHHEKTESFKVFADGFYCYGCGERGDIIDFVQKIEKISFSEAFKMLGGTYEKDENKKKIVHSVILKRNEINKNIEDLKKEIKKKYDFISGLQDRLHRQNPMSWLWAYYKNTIFYEFAKIEFLKDDIEKLKGEL